MSEMHENTAGDITGWPFLRIEYPTDAAKLAALLPPGIDATDDPRVLLSIYCFPVPDEPEYGIVTNVAASYRGQPGWYSLAYGIDQEQAIYISKDMNGQPKHPAEIEYFRCGERVAARCMHHGYTFVEYEGKVAGAAPLPEPHEETELWIKVSRAVGGAEKAYDFPPHVVTVKSQFQHLHREKLEGELLLRDSPWDPIARHLPVEGEVESYLAAMYPTTREIELAGQLDPEAFWPFVDTIGSSRWPGSNGGPRK